MRIFFKNFLRIIFKLSLFALAIAGLSWLGTKELQKNFSQISEINPFTENKKDENIIPRLTLTGPQEAFYEWEYDGKKYSLREILYQSVYEAYKASPKSFVYTGNLPSNWEEEYYGMFMQEKEGGEIFSKIANDLKILGEKNKLTSDQIAELTLAFVQSIPYDDARAESILAGTGAEKPKYPYEILFEGRGVCSDKSYLAASLLKELGYGTALFIYESANHMAIGIKCSSEYSNYNSDYCFAETTSSGFKIGVIPSLDPESNKTVELKEIGTFEKEQRDNLQELGEVKIIVESEGAVYQGIADTIKMAREMNSLQKEILSLSKDLANLKEKISEARTKIDDMSDKLKKLLKKKEYEEYNKLVAEYNDAVSDYQDDIRTYNKKVATYNQKVQRYNLLVKYFYQN